jgi:hypothetical protein
MLNKIPSWNPLIGTISSSKDNSVFGIDDRNNKQARQLGGDQKDRQEMLMYQESEQSCLILHVFLHQLLWMECLGEQRLRQEALPTIKEYDNWFFRY